MLWGLGVILFGITWYGKNVTSMSFLFKSFANSKRNFPLSLYKIYCEYYGFISEHLFYFVIYSIFG